VYDIKGKPEPDNLKVSMSFEDGWKASGEVLVSGPNTFKKAKVIADIFWKKLEHKFEATDSAMVGAGSCWPAQLSNYEPNEIMLKFSVRDKNVAKIKDFGKALSTLILSGPAGMAVTGRGRPKPVPVIAYWPALMHRTRVQAKVLTVTTRGDEEFFEITFPLRVRNIHEEPTPKAAALSKKYKKPAGKMVKVKLQEIAYARSGDKGDTCNIGVLARSADIYNWLKVTLTPDKVKAFFKGTTKGKVIRYELDNLQGLNFLLEETLGGGGTRALIIDPQGKTLAQALLQMTIEVPQSLLGKKR
jgi:hypothetical protein